jgi:steroid delta-isomerase-like uncharacterized protein
MKSQLAFIAALLIALSACKQQTNAELAPTKAAASVVPVAAPMDTEAFVMDYMDAWNAHNPELAASFFHQDGEYYDASVGDPQRGRQAALDNVIAVFIKAVPDCKWEMRSKPIATSDGISFEWTFSGTNTGDWNPSNKATGKPIQFNGVTFIRFKDGKIVYQGDYYDAATLNKQLGW